MKKGKTLLLLSAIAVTATIALGSSLTSCGPKSDPGTTWQVIDDSTVSLDLPSTMLIESIDSTYFSPYIVKDKGEGQFDLISNGGDALLTEKSSANLLAYGVPEGATLSCKVTDASGAPTSELQVFATGAITVPTVSEKTDFIITLYAKVAADGGEKIIKKDVNISVIPYSQLQASTVKTYGILDVRDRSEITSQLEKFAYKNGLTGVSISDNGGYALYNERIHSPLLDADNYLAGYGFGTYTYGSIDAPLAGESTEKYKMYYHSQLTPSEETGTVNYLDSDQASVSDLYTYMSGGYYKTELNEDYTEQIYTGSLARSEPIPLDLDPTTQTATKWKIPVWVGGDSTDVEKGVMKDLSFRTASSTYAKYDNRKITLSDYLTPVKLLATGSVGWYRGNEQAAEKTANRQIKGFSDFYNNSSEAKSLPSDAEFSAKVGVELDPTDNSIIFTMNGGFTQEFAIYQLNSLWSNPMCEEFITELGGGDIIEGSNLYGTSPSPLTPVDTSLSVGPYYLESYSSQNVVTFAKNEKWHETTDAEGRSIYQIEGYHFKVNSALDTDKLASITAWENNLTEACSIPDEKWEQYENDSRKRATLGDRTSKWTFNRMDKLLWDMNFGEGGAWYEEYNPNGEITWNVKPISSNDNFFYALNLGVDRVAYAAKYHVNPSIDYQNPIAKVNPVTGELYNKSQEHADAVAYVYGDALDDVSTAPTKAVGYMQQALIEELNAGHYTLGTEEKPTQIKFETGSLDAVSYRDGVNLTSQNWSDVVAKACTTYVDENGENPLVGPNGKPRITFNLTTEYVPSDTSMEGIITKGLWAGKFDAQNVYLITGNAYDTINNMDILMSDKMGGFELNFAVDTTIPSADIYYDGKYWSFNSLWSSANGGTVVNDEGKEITEVAAIADEDVEVVPAEDGASVSVTFKLTNLVDGLTPSLTNGNVPYALNSTFDAYVEATSFVVNADGTATAVFDSSVFIDGAAVGASGSTYVQMYVPYEVKGNSEDTATLETVYGFIF